MKIKRVKYNYQDKIKKFLLILIILLIGFNNGGCRFKRRRSPVVSRPGTLQGVRGIFHKIKSGETIWYLSRLYGIPQIIIKEKNPLVKASSLTVGSELFIPGDKKKLRASAYYNYRKLPVPGKYSSSPASNKKKPAKTYKKPNSKPKPKPQIKIDKPNKKQISKEERKRLVKMGFIWPLRGRITSTFGEIRKDGSVHSGLDIAAVRGTPIHSSKEGKVEFSGAIRGYGNCIIISHPGDYYTLYAHNHENLVKYGQRISKGQKIAIVGNTGNTTGRTGNHLHFEIREGQHPRDPEHFLP